MLYCQKTYKEGSIKHTHFIEEKTEVQRVSYSRSLMMFMVTLRLK